MSGTYKFEDLPKEIAGYAIEAQKLRANAHAPYSNFFVSALIILNDGNTIGGVNYESASYGLSLCAERAAIATAQSNNLLHDLKAFILMGGPDNDHSSSTPVSPCGACRQWLHEVAERIGIDFPIYCISTDLSAVLQLSALSLLPNAFSNASLDK